MGPGSCLILHGVEPLGTGFAVEFSLLQLEYHATLLKK